MIFLRFIFCIFSILITGYTILRLFFHPKERLPLGEVIVLAFGIGTGFVSLETFFLSFTKILLSAGYLLLFQLILFVIAIFKFKKYFFYWRKSYTDEKLTYSPLTLFFLLIILWEIIYVFLDAFRLPFTAWDAWGHWGFQAKIFFLEKTFPFQLWTQLPWIKHPNHLGSPLLIPFLEAYIYFFLGQVHEPLVKVFCSFYYVCIIVLFYYQLRRQFLDKFVLGSCLCLATIPNLINQAPIGYMDIPLTFYITCGILYIWRYLQEKDRSFLLLGSIFIGLSMWTKNEGFSLWLALFLSCILICLWFKLNINKRGFLFTVLFIPLLIYFPWLIFKYSLGIKVGYFQSSLNEFFGLAKQRLPLILDIWIRNCLNTQKWNIFWFSFIFSLLWFFVKPYKKISIFLFFIVVFQLIFYFIIYIIWPITMSDIELQILNSVDRLPLHIIPVALLFICQQLGETWKIA